MALYLNKKELVHRISNGFLSHNGYINGELYNIYKKNDIDIDEIGNMRFLKCILAIIDSMDEEGLEIYPKNLRGSRLRDIREKRGKSAGWVAVMAGISKTTVYDIENGLTVPRKTTLGKIAKVLHVTIEELG